MSLFYLPTEPTSFSSPHSHSHSHSHSHHQHHQHRTQPSCPRFELGFPPQQQQQRSFNPFELNPLTTSPPHHLPRHPHHHQQPSATSYQPSQFLPFDPIEAHKQRLLAEFAQSLDQLYPSTSSSSTPPPRQQHPVVPSLETERIRYLEAQLKEQQLRKELEAERIRLAKLKEVQRREEEEERRREAVVEKQRQEKLHHAYLVQQHRLQQQQLAEEEQQLRRRFLEQRQQQQQRQEQQQPSSLGGLEQFLALLTGSESPRREIEPPVQQEKKTAEPLLNGLDQLLAFAQALENSPVLRAGDSQVASEEPPQQSSSRPTSPVKPLPPSPLTTLRSLQSQLHSLLSSPTSSSTPTILSHHLEKLLIDADGLESEGNEVVRKERRKFVQEVEKVLATLEERAEVVVSSDPTPTSTPSLPTTSSTSSLQPAVAPTHPTPSPAVDSHPPTSTLDASPSSSPTPPFLDDAASDTSSNVSSSLKPSLEPGEEGRESLQSKGKGKGRAASVTDEEDEEERYEFV